MSTPTKTKVEFYLTEFFPWTKEKNSNVLSSQLFKTSSNARLTLAAHLSSLSKYSILLLTKGFLNVVISKFTTRYLLFFSSWKLPGNLCKPGSSSWNFVPTTYSKKQSKWWLDDFIWSPSWLFWCFCKAKSRTSFGSMFTLEYDDRLWSAVFLSYIILSVILGGRWENETFSTIQNSNWTPLSVKSKNICSSTTTLLFRVFVAVDWSFFRKISSTEFYETKPKI